MPPGPTPTNSGARAARTEEANQTPREHKAPDRDRGNDNFRRDEDNKMVNGKRWVQVTVDTFMDKYVPAPRVKPFNPNLHDCDLTLTYFDPKNGEPRQEKKCYPPLVRAGSLRPTSCH